MFVIEWNRPCSVGIGALKLGPGVNEVDPKEWKKLADSHGYKRAIAAYIEQGDIIVHDGEKPTQSIVSKTYNVDILEEWLVEAKGPLKGAIKKQIAGLTKEIKDRA